MTTNTQQATPARATDTKAASAAGETGAARRLERRELHRSRSLSASIALLLTALALAAPGALVLAERAGFAVPGVTLPGSEAMTSWITPASPIGIGIGAATAIVGIVFLGLGLSRARRARRALQRDGVVVIAEDRVIASAMSRAAARAARSTPDHASTTLGGGRAEVQLRSPAGYKLDVAAARESVTGLVGALRPKRQLQVTMKEGRA